MKDIVGIRFKKAARVYDFDNNGLDLKAGNTVIVEVNKGLGMGTVVNATGTHKDSKRKLKKVIRKADEVDMERFGFNSEREKTAFKICKDKIDQYKLPMKLVSVEYLFDSSKAIFYFTSETRIDFRELVKSLASEFHTRIEMRQIGVRDEAKMIGGLGPCGRMLCCAAFLSDFEPVTIKMAKEQNLALNPVKISGICGRLMCCLSFEYESYKGRKKGEKKDGPKDGAKGAQRDGQRGGPKGTERNARKRGARDDQRGGPKGAPKGGHNHHHNHKQGSCGGCPKGAGHKES